MDNVSARTPRGLGGVKFYVDAEDGDDRAVGSQESPWRTLARVNEEVLQPGDAVYFKAGCRWQGQLRPQGSGSAGHPICIDRYGEGSRPVIDLGEACGAAILLTNQEYWEIRNLEITSGAPAGIDHRQAIVVLGEGQGRVFHHIVVSGCYIHDLWGLLGGHYQGIDSYSSTMILVASPRGEQVASFDEVIIEANVIERVDRSGIIVWTPTPLASASRVVVRGNRMENLGGDAILVLGSLEALVEHNVVHRSCLRSGDPDVVLAEGDEDYNRSSAAIWLHTCDDSIMQFNEVYDSGKMARNNDGMAYDLDNDCHRCLVQYNYSRCNHGGFLLIMGTALRNSIRFNISENDQSHVLYIVGQPDEGNLLYNNTFYRNYGTAEIYTAAAFMNNIFYAAGQGRYKLMLPQSGTFEHNAYYGPWLGEKPQDTGALLEDPQLVAPGTGGEGLGSLSGYRLHADSPCHVSGKFIADSGKRDFWGDRLEQRERPIGACG